MRMWKSICIVALIAFLSTAHASVTFYSGNKLKEQFESSNLYAQGTALGYVVGVADFISGWSYCPPGGESGIRAGQLADVVQKYFRENPDKLHLSADSLITLALGKAWPCPKKEAVVTPRPPKPKPKAEDKSPF